MKYLNWTNPRESCSVVTGYLWGRAQQLVGTLMLLKGILRHVKPVTEEGFLRRQLSRKLIWSSFLGDGDSQDERQPSWAFDMKTNKQTIKGKNLGGRQGGCFVPPRLLTRNWSCTGGSGSLYFLCKNSLINITFSSKHTDFPFFSLNLCTYKLCFFFQGLFLISSTFALFVMLIVSLSMSLVLGNLMLMPETMG